MKTKSMLGLGLLAAAGLGAWTLYKRGALGFSGLTGLGYMPHQMANSKLQAHRWMEAQQAYRADEGGMEVERVNSKIGASDTVAREWYKVLQRNNAEYPAIRQQVDSDGIGRPY